MARSAPATAEARGVLAAAGDFPVGPPGLSSPETAAQGTRRRAKARADLRLANIEASVEKVLEMQGLALAKLRSVDESLEAQKAEIVQLRSPELSKPSASHLGSRQAQKMSCPKRSLHNRSA